MFLAFAALLLPAAMQQADIQGQDWLGELAARRSWYVETSGDGAWRFYASVDSGLSRDTLVLLDRLYPRLRELLGGLGPKEGVAPHKEPDPRFPAFDDPTLLALFSDQEDIDAVARAVGERWNYLKPWSDAVEKGHFPLVRVWEPPLSLVLHNASTEKVKRPDVRLIHQAIQIEVARRFGPVPFWLLEGLGYALQDELVGGVYGYSNQQAHELSEEYHQTWRSSAQAAVTGADPGLDALVQEVTTPFQQERAYRQFAFGVWLLRTHGDRVAPLMEAFAAARPADARTDVPWAPGTADQERILESVLGKGFLEEMAAWWGKAPTDGGPNAASNAVLGAVAQVVEKHGLKTYTSRDKRITIVSDFKAREVQRAMKKTEEIFRKLDKTFGKPKEADSVWGLFLLDREVYQDLCHAIAEADPTLGPAVEGFLKQTGFTLYRPPLTTYFHDVRVQEEADPVRTLNHNFVHLEVFRRFGVVPLWISEGLANATEEEAYGDIHAHCNRNEFVFTASRGAWRNTAARLILKDKKKTWTLPDLYGYSARPYQDELAHLAFAFATYGLEGNPKGLKAFLEALQKDYRENWKGGGRFEPDPELVARLVHESFGEDFEKKFLQWTDKKLK